MNFGDSFKQCRKEMNFSQKYVADALGIHQSNVSDWENNISRPEYEKLIQLAELYNVTLYQLLGIEDPFFR
jgi:transcriptional regulator with XRE-family HTH domain